VRRALVLTALLAIAAVGGALAYRAAARERSYRMLIAAGDAALAANETLDAIEDFSGAIAVRPDAMLARLRRGETYRRRGDFEVAARDFRAAAALDPTATRPLESLGDVLYAQERFRRAAETYEERLKLDDRSASIRYKLALARYRDGTVDVALSEARRAIALDDQLADAYYVAAMCLRDKGQTEDAADSFRQAISIAPGLLVAREELADLYAASSRFNEQIEQLQVLAGLDPRRTERQIAVALAQAHAGRPELAVATLNAALDVDRDQSPVNAALGRVWLQVFDARRDPVALSKALEALERAASALTATSDTKALYGKALMLSGQFEAAEQLFQQATERYPVDPSALRQLALVAEQLGHPALARAALLDYMSLVQADGEMPADAARIGTLSLKLNDAGAALPWLRRALSVNQDDVSTLVALANAQLLTGDVASARATVDRVNSLAPGDAQATAVDQRVRRAETNAR
jgi:tetratricopeptide (TPR) repeat protein